MQPFALLRLWLRQGPPAERRAAFTAIAIAIVLLAVALVPVAEQRPGADQLAPLAAATTQVPGATAGEPAAGALQPGAEPQPGAAGVAAPGVTAGGPAGSAAESAADGAPPGTASGDSVQAPGTAGGGTASTSGAADRCAGRTASAVGITKETARVAMAIVDLAGVVGNATFGLRTDQAEVAQAVTAYINKNGGVACGRKLVLKTYKVNPVDSNDQQQKCLQMVEDKNFMAVSIGAYITPVSVSCFPRNKLLLVNTSAVGAEEARKSYPYLLATVSSTEQQVRNGVLGLAAKNWFRTSGFTKLGLLQDNCLPSANEEIARSLKASGVTRDKLETYTLDCNLVASSNQIGQAVVRMRTAGVSHMLLTGSVLNMRNFVKAASQQEFRPKYAVTDKGSSTSSGGAENWDDAFDGALAVTSVRIGELNSGIRNAEVQLCDKIVRAAGLPGIRTEAPDGSLAGICDALFFTKKALDARGLSPTPLNVVEGVGTLGRIPTGYTGDSLFDRPGKLTGGDFARTITWTKTCRCFKLLDRHFRPKF